MVANLKCSESRLVKSDSLAVIGRMHPVRDRNIERKERKYLDIIRKRKNRYGQPVRILLVLFVCVNLNGDERLSI